MASAAGTAATVDAPSPSVGTCAVDPPVDAIANPRVDTIASPAMVAIASPAVDAIPSPAMDASASDPPMETGPFAASAANSGIVAFALPDTALNAEGG